MVRGDESKVIEKLEKNRPVNVCDQTGVSALSRATYNGLRRVALLPCRGHFLIGAGNFDMCELLVMHCADVNRPDADARGNTGDTLLLSALTLGRAV